MTKTYLKKWLNVGFFPEDSVTEVASRNPNDIRLKDREFAFQYFDRTETEVNGEILRGEAKNYSPMYYPGGIKYSLKEIEENFPKEEILIKNMKWNSNNKGGIKTRVGTWAYQDDNAVVL